MQETDFRKIKEVFEKAKKGDKKAFLEIYEAYFKPLYRYVYLKIGDKTESDDLVQDVFMKVMDSDEELNPHNLPFFIHFHDVARKLVSDWKRKRRRTRSFDDNVENYSNENFGINDEDVKMEELNNLHIAIKELSNEQQDAVIFKFINDFSNEDLGTLLDVSPLSARRLEAQGLILIRDILKKRYE